MGIKKRMLFVIPNIRVGTGITSVIMNHYDRLIKDGYHIDFCMLQDRESPYKQKIIDSNGKIYVMPEGRNGYPDKKKTPGFIEELIKNGRYDVVHIHIIGRLGVCAAKYAKKYSVPYRIYHAHNPRDIHDLHSLCASVIFDNLCVRYSNYYLACSKDAGKSVFGKRRFEVIKNTIDTEKIRFSQTERLRIRKEFGISETTKVLGTVCRLSHQKNPFFIIDIFKAFHERCNDSVLLWAGSGDLDKQVKEYVDALGLSSCVYFLGSRSDVAGLYSAMDAFVLPSRYEGLGIVYIEAQSCGLPTFASDVVPKDTKVTDLIEYLSLSDKDLKWAKTILDTISTHSTQDRSRYSNIVVNAGYDSSLNNDLSEYYTKLLQESGE